MEKEQIIEQLDTVSASLDDLMASLDSSQWKGEGKLILAAFDTDGAIVEDVGAAIAAGHVFADEKAHSVFPLAGLCFWPLPR